MFLVSSQNQGAFCHLGDISSVNFQTFQQIKDAVADLDQGRTQIKFEGGAESSGGAEKFSEIGDKRTL